MGEADSAGFVSRRLGAPTSVLQQEVILVLPLYSQLRTYAESCIWQGQAGVCHIKDHLASYPRPKESGEQMASSKCSNMEACRANKADTIRSGRALWMAPKRQPSRS
jgi:hypothetical protein